MSASSATAPMFSYAQAARGLTPSIQNQSATTSSASSEHGNKDSAVSFEPAANSPKPKITPVVANISSDKKSMHSPLLADENVDKPQNVSDIQNHVQEVEIDDRINGADMSPPSSMRKEASNSIDQNGPAAPESRTMEVDTDKTSNADDLDKNKEIDDDWEKVSVPSVAAEKELRAAPVPVVNIWQQRKEAQEAKLKEQSQRPANASAIVKPKSQPSQAREDNKRRPGARESGTEKDSAAQRRTNSGVRSHTTNRKEQSPPQLSPRSLSKQGEKTASSFRSAGDAETWPTPENAVIDERRRSTTHEKSDKPDVKATTQKKWIQMPFVPTAKFETQLPPAAAARRGGRAANRGRDSTNRGAHATSAAQNPDKNEVGSMGPPPQPKQSIDQDRGRKGENSRTERASSVPTHMRDNTHGDETMTGVRKASVIPQHDQTEIARAHATAQRSAVVGDESSATDDSRSSSQQPVSVSANPRKFELEAPQAASNHGQVESEGTSRNSVHTDRNKGASRDEFRTGAEPGDRSFPPGREWSRGRPDSTREKPDSWRERREPRLDRGRGVYRGRGNHSSYGNHSQTYTAPLPQNGFESPKSYSNESRSRQASQPFNQSQSMSASRNNPRSQSIPLTNLPNAFYAPIQGFPQALSPVQGDSNYGSFSGQMPSGIMNAMPYADQLNSMALISMVVTQLEYYFSINNLCKDLFLRKNMDSQGFVPLGVIAGFKRIQALTDGQMSHEQFRTVCQQAPHVEFVTGDDGQDKVRARGNWRDFILPMDERLPSAQNEGPNFRSQSRHQSTPLLHHFPGQSGPNRSPAAVMNGFSEPFTPSMHSMAYPPPPPFDGANPDGYGTHAEEQATDQARKSSTTSPFSQMQSPPVMDLGISSSITTNGHRQSASNAVQTENVFPDDKIPELKVVVRDPAFEVNQSESTNNLDAKNSKLRGGAGSPQQLDQISNIQFGQQSSDTEEDFPFWTRHGHISKVPEGPSFIHEDYLSLRNKALTQCDNKDFQGALTVLYPFWSSFLVENFNLSMYQDFANLAAEEAAAEGSRGQTHLLTFYEALLKRRSPISERIASDLVKLFRAEHESGQKGPAFETLRTSLRNGATDFKTVKRIMSLLKSDEKAGLGV